MTISLSRAAGRPVLRRSLRWLGHLALATTGLSVVQLAFPETGVAQAQPEANLSPAPFNASRMDPMKGAVGEDPTRCLGLPGRPDLVVQAKELKNTKGSIRFVLYGDNPEDFLAKGKRLARVEVPAKEGASVCISLPHAGNYAIAVLHDINANGKFNLASDGGGFSNNPKIMFSQPSYSETAFHVTDNGGMINVRMRYLSKK